MTKHYQFQQFMAPNKGMPPELYLRCNAQSVEREGDGGLLIDLPADEICSFDTYFNSLYAAYWTINTSISRVGLSVRLNGSAIIRLRWSVEGHLREIAEFPVSSTDPKSEELLWLKAEGGELFEQVRRGRLFVEIHATSNVQLLEMAFVTDRRPVRSVKLSIGLCTFNREDDLASTLASVTTLRKNTPQIGEIFVVNHAAPFSNPALLSAVDKPGIVSIRQRNLGGCGGFNRTMIECLAADEAYTHHLIMDDDIVLDPGVIVRAIDFLSYINSEVVLGGHMLESNDPTILHEAGARLDPFWYVVSQAKYTDVSQPRNLNVFNDQFDVDYNAWWFCILPTNAIREAKFSPPFFIHGDDIEYGLRMQKLGYSTISPPGIGVWHESFAAKNKDWIEYYDLRNRLIMSVSHPKKCHQPDVLYLFGLFLYLLLTHRYRAAEMCYKALADFLAGPDDLFEFGSDDCHQTVVQHAQEKDTIEIIEDDKLASWEDAPQTNKDSSVVFFAKCYISSFVKILFLPSKLSKHIHRRDTLHPASVGNDTYYLMDDLSRTRYIKHSPNRRFLLSGSLKAIWLSVKYALMRGRKTKEWQNKIGNYQTAEFWKTQFGEGN